MKPDRHTLYFRLLDIAFAVQIVAIADIVATKVLKTANLETVLSPTAYNAAMLAIFLAGVLLPCLLVFQRWMRDDFSEALWQKTAGTVLKCMIILPLPIMALTVELILAGPSFQELQWQYGKGADTDRAISTIIDTMRTIWLLAPVTFVAAFQWHRWRNR